MAISDILVSLPALGGLFSRHMAGPAVGAAKAGPSRKDSGFVLSCDDYQALFEYSREATFVIDDQGVIVLTNPAGCALFGYEQGELAGSDAYRLLHPEDRSKFRGVAATIERGRVFAETARALTKDGQVIDVEVRGSAVRLNKAGYFVATLRDVTARKHAEAALEASERRFRDLAELTADRFWETDMNQRFTFVSAPFREGQPDELDPSRLLGRTRREVHRDAGIDLKVADDIDEHMSRREIFRDLTFRYSHPANGEVWVRLSGRPVVDEQGNVSGYRGIARDCTHEISQQRAIEESESKLNAIVNNAPMGVCLKNPDGTYDLINDTLCDLFGLSRGEILGKPSSAILPEDSARLFHSKDKSVFDSGKPVLFETHFRLPSGESAELDIVKFPVRGEDGRVAQVGTIVRDATRQKEAERLYRQATKMEAVSQLTGGVAHEFNNLLAVIMGNAELISGAPDATADSRETANEVVKAAERGADLIARLLTFSRRRSMAVEVHDLNTVIDGMVPLLRRSLGSHIDIELSLAPNLAKAKFDVTEFENCLVGLAVNARDAMPKGGRLTIGTRNAAREQGTCQDDLLAPGDYVCVTVTDQGCGMTEAVASRAFDPFFTTKEVGSGTGLGLSAVYGFVELSGGHVELDSVEGEGTSVRLYLPTEPGDPREDAREPRADASAEA